MMKHAAALLNCCLIAVCTPAIAQTAQEVPPVAAVDASVAQPAAADESNTSAQTVSVSQVRIVRLSQTKGQVELDRKTEQKFDAAFVNLPIVEGAALRTKDGLAEVEFEDNSSVRLAPDSQVEFPRLGRSASGSTITSIHLVRGSLYVSLSGGKAGGDFTVNAGNEAIVVTPSTHLRLDLTASNAKMVVFQGSATVSGPSGSLVVVKKKAISFDTASSVAPQFTQTGEAAPFDTWDKNAVDYHKVRANTLVGGLAGSPYSYGVNDLSYYGSFSDVGGCGTMWRPHLANAGFYPYSSGVWSWYPGQGYSWVSLYPWGWAPFHSGSWDYCPAGGGWGWRPQGSWQGLQNHPSKILRNPAQGPIHGPVRPTPPPAPGRGQPTLIGVNLNSLNPSRQQADGKFVFRGGSAGLGVPRGVFNLGKVSQRVETHGSVTTTPSERQAQMGFMAPSRSSAVASSNSGAIGSHNSPVHGASNSSSVSSRSVSSSPSFSSAPASSGAASSVRSAGSAISVGGGAHH